MMTKFNKLYNKIIQEEQDQYKNTGLISPIIPQNPEYQDIKLALIPGKFKPPQDKHINMILQYCGIADVVIIFISNTSINLISNRVLSKSNLQQTAKLVSSIQESNLNNTVIIDICNTIINSSDTITFNILNTLLNKLYKEFYSNKKLYNKYINEINKIKINLKNNLFKSVKEINGKEITPKISKNIFETYITKYNLQNKVNIVISKNPSPMIDIVSFVNNKCKNCIIYLGSTKNEDNIQWDSLLKKFEINPTNEIIPYSV